MLSKLCASRIHEWGPDGVCVRPECGKIKGLRGKAARRPSKAPAGVKPPTRPAPVSKPVVPGSRFAEAAARLAARRGHTPPAAPEPEVIEPDAVLSEAEAAAESAVKRYSMTDWFGGQIPEMVRSGCAWTIRKGGREPFEADPDWSGRFDETYQETVGKALPNLSLPAPVALLVATFFMWLSMRWGAPKIKGAEDGEASSGTATPAPSPAATASADSPTGAPAPKGPAPKDASPWETKPNAQAPADSPPSVQGSASLPILSSLQPPSSQPEGSDSAGTAGTVARLSLVGE